MKNKTFLITIHILFWILGAGIESLWFDFNDSLSTLNAVIWLSVASFPARAIPFYLNYYVWVPYFLIGKRNLFFPLWLLGSISSFLLFFLTINIISECYLFDQDVNFEGWFISAWENVFICLGVSTGLRFALNWFKNIEELEALSLKKTETEIEVLRLNINFPYVLSFLKTLKNQSSDDPQAIQHSLLLFSDQLRNQLYGKKPEENKEVQEN